MKTTFNSIAMDRLPRVSVRNGGNEAMIEGVPMMEGLEVEETGGVDEAVAAIGVAVIEAVGVRAKNYLVR